MSRLSFRVPLETPRPRSALLLVALASATLAVTSTIPPPVLALQALAIGAAAWLRGAPRDWQQRGPWLPMGLAASALIVLGETLGGASAGVALAQLVLLASGLQLLDARPRRSEFLLVALALLQVLLAASLTDSLLFPPLLMAFLPTCVWTLLVHTLRSEALEAGDLAAAREAITPGLLGMTLVASALSLLLAIGLFLLLPRMHEGLVRTGGGKPQAIGGFSDRVELGDLGRIRGDPAIMLRVETLAGTPPAPENAYWRGLAFDRFDGHAWSIAAALRTPVEGDAVEGVALSRRRDPPDLVQRILREPMASGVLFGPGDPLRLKGATGRLVRDDNGGLYAPQSADARVRYELSVDGGSPDQEELAQDVAMPPPDGARWLALPELAPDIASLATEITALAPNDLARARALESWLRKNGHYSDTPPPRLPGDPRPPLERFLFGELRGHCEYFASAMVVLARSVGLPARLMNGFAGGHLNHVGNFVELTGSDAHAWVEVYFRDHGWVRFDPTPPDLRLVAAGTEPSLGERLGELRSALELLWFQHVVEFDREHQVGAAIGAWRALRRWLPQEGDAADEQQSYDSLAWLRRVPDLLWAGLGGGLVLAVIAWRLFRGRARGAPLPQSYARALRLLARCGFVRPPALTPRAFARGLRNKLPSAGAAAFDALTEAYLGERYGGRSAPTGEAELRVLRDSLRG